MGAGGVSAAKPPGGGGKAGAWGTEGAGVGGASGFGATGELSGIVMGESGIMLVVHSTLRAGWCRA